MTGEGARGGSARWVVPAFVCLLLGGNLVGWAMFAPPPPVPEDAPAEAAPVIPPGREDAVRSWLAPVFAQGVSGRAATGFRIERDHVVVQLEGEGGQLVVRADDALDAELRFEGVPPDAALRASLEGRTLRDLFETRGDADPLARTLLTPASRSTGLSPGVLVTLAMSLLLVFALGLGVGRSEPGSAPQGAGEPRAGERVRRALRRLGLPFAVLALVGARVWATLRAPLESDEVRPLLRPAFFADGHDAALHPPLARAFGKSWIALSGWDGEAAGAWRLRAGYLALACAAGFFLLAVRHRTPRGGSKLPWERVGAAAALFGPTVVTASVLARPYAVVALLAAIVVFACARPARSARPLQGVAFAAAGLAVWTDLLAGVILGALVVAWLARASWRRAGVAALGLGLAAALVPGVVDAALRPDPSWPASEPVPDLGAFAAEVSGYVLTGTWLPSIGAGVVALLLLVALVRAGRTRPDVVVATLVGVGVAIALATVRDVRPRNLVPLPFFAALLVPAALARRPKHPS